jgi:hypothetical protein
MLVGPNGGCSVFGESGREAVSMSSWVKDGGGTEGVVGGEHWEFSVTGSRRLQILGRPTGEDHPYVGFVGSSTAGVMLLSGGRPSYRFKNPILGRSRVERVDGDRLLLVHARFFPRFRISFQVVGHERERGTVLPLLGVFACLTVISVARPSLHWMTLFSGAPLGAVQELKAAMSGELPPGGGAWPSQLTARKARRTTSSAPDAQRR